ncbi:MAG: GtrA family protein [Burkholderiales bacterium]|nr:GtrA family protein [Burkholderiales bacterium]
MTHYASMVALLRQFVKFTGVGFVSAIGHYGLLIGLVQLAGAAAVPASAAGAVFGAGINYSLNYRYTFSSSKRHRDAVLKFAAVAGVGLALNTLFMWVGVHLIGAHYLLSQIVTTGLVLIWSFAGNRYWTFHTAGARD